MLYRHAALVCVIAGCIPPDGSWTQTTYSHRRTMGGYGQNGDSGYGGNGSSWLCTAEGSMSTSSDDGPWKESSERGYGDGATRDDAYLNALQNCNALINTSASLGSIQGEYRSGGTCSVVDCTGPQSR